MTIIDEIEELRKSLNLEIVKKGYKMNDETVLMISKQLDDKLVKYYKIQADKIDKEKSRNIT